MDGQDESSFVLATFSSSGKLANSDILSIATAPFSMDAYELRMRTSEFPRGTNLQSAHQTNGSELKTDTKDLARATPKSAAETVSLNQTASTATPQARIAWNQSKNTRRKSCPPIRW